MAIRDTQREIRKNDFLKGALSSKTALTERPRGLGGSLGAVVGKYPKGVALGGGVSLVALGAGGMESIRNAGERAKEQAKVKTPKKKIKKADTLKRYTDKVKSEDTISNEDKASLAIGGGVGAAAMPMRQPKARGQRKYALNQMWEQAERAGTGDKADIKISPTTLGNVAEHKGNRAHNTGYTAAMARGATFSPDKRYEADLYKDSKGRVSLRQTNGRHFAEVQNMLDKDIPTSVRLIHGEAPEETSALKALYRYGKSRKERTALKEERGLDPAKIQRRADTYESKLGRPAQAINQAAQRVMRHETVPIKHAKSNLKGRQAAFVAGGAGTMYAGNKILRREDKSPTKAITTTSTKISDTTRNKVGTVILPNEKPKEITKGLPKGLRAVAARPEELMDKIATLPQRKKLEAVYMERRASANRAGKMAGHHVKWSRSPVLFSNEQSMSARLAGDLMNAGEDARNQSRQFQNAIRPNTVTKMIRIDTEKMKRTDAQARRNVGPIPKNAKVNANGYPMVLDKEVRRLNRVQKRDDRDRYAAAGGGAALGAAAMPVRESAGGPGKKFAQKYGHLPSGVHQISSEDALKIAAPGVRRGNKDYTTRMAADIHRGSFNPEMGRVQITDDGARFTGGQHRAVGRAWAQEPTQTVEIVRSKGHMGATAPGIVAAGKRLKRIAAPAWYQKKNPGSTKELLERDKGVSQKKVDQALSNATPDKAKLDPVLDAGGLKKLKTKQAAFLVGGTGAAVAANELRRNHNESIGKKWEVEAGRNDRWIRSKGEQRAVLHDPLYLGGAATALGGAGVAARRVMRGNPKTVVPSAISIAGGVTGIVGAHSAANRWRRSQGLTNRNIITGAPQPVGKASPRPDYIAKKRPPGAPNAFLHPIKRGKFTVNQGIATASRTAGQNAAQGVADSVKANIPTNLTFNLDALGHGIGTGGKVAGAGLVGAGLLAGGAKIAGDVIGANASRKAAEEATKRAKMYTAGGVGGAGLIGTGIAFNRRKQ